MIFFKVAQMFALVLFQNSILTPFLINLIQCEAVVYSLFLPLILFHYQQYQLLEPFILLEAHILYKLTSS